MNTPRDEHSEYEELAVGWALHSLEPDEEAAFLPHLTDCPVCRQVVEETSETLGELAFSVPQVDPAPGLKARIMAEVTGEQRTGGPVEPAGASVTEITAARDHEPAPHGRHVRPHRVIRRTRALLATGVAAMLAIVVVLAVWNFQIRSDRDDSRTEADRYRSIVQQLTLPGAHLAQLATPDGTPMATVITDKQGATVISDAMPRNDAANSVYVLWGLRDGKPAPLGTFDITSSDVAVAAVKAAAGSTGSYPQYAVSKENGRTAPKTPSQVLASGNAV